MNFSLIFVLVFVVHGALADTPLLEKEITKKKEELSRLEPQFAKEHFYPPDVWKEGQLVQVVNKRGKRLNARIRSKTETDTTVVWTNQAGKSRMAVIPSAQLIPAQIEKTDLRYWTVNMGENGEVVKLDSENTKSWNEYLPPKHFMEAMVFAKEIWTMRMGLLRREILILENDLQLNRLKKRETNAAVGDLERGQISKQVKALEDRRILLKISVQEIRDRIKREDWDLHEIQHAQCEEIAFDNRNKMGPDTNQRRSPLCWAHASAALLEEQMCLSNIRYCNKNVSRSEVAASPKANLFRLAKPDSGTMADTLNHFVNEGEQEVCLDKYGSNPFDEDEMDYLQKVRSVYQVVKKNGCIDRSPLVAEKVSSLYLDIIDLLHKNRSSWKRNMKEKILTNQELFKMVEVSHSESEFVQKVLLFYCTGKGKRSFKRPDIQLVVKSSSFMDRAYFPTEGVG
ncbi:MAG: hypothetical protein ABIQ95_11090, partial [Bdellovibrionia bacterium]